MIIDKVSVMATGPHLGLLRFELKDVVQDGCQEGPVLTEIIHRVHSPKPRLGLHLGVWLLLNCRMITIEER